MPCSEATVTNIRKILAHLRAPLLALFDALRQAIAQLGHHLIAVRMP